MQIVFNAEGFFGHITGRNSVWPLCTTRSNWF